MTASGGGQDAAISHRMQAAADWLQSLDDIELSDEQVVAWLDWYNASEENRIVFDEMQALYLSFKHLRSDHRRILLEVLTSPPQAAPGWRKWLFALGFTLAFASLAGWWWCLQSR